MAGLAAGIATFLSPCVLPIEMPGPAACVDTGDGGPAGADFGRVRLRSVA